MLCIDLQCKPRFSSCILHAKGWRCWTSAHPLHCFAFNEGTGLSCWGLHGQTFEKQSGTTFSSTGMGSLEPPVWILWPSNTMMATSLLLRLSTGSGGLLQNLALDWSLQDEQIPSSFPRPSKSQANDLLEKEKPKMSTSEFAWRPRQLSRS